MITTLFDSAAAGNAFDGSKTLAQLGLTADSASSISGGNLVVNNTSGTYNGVTLGNTLFPKITFTTSFLATGSAIDYCFVLRQQANGDCLLLFLMDRGQWYLYQNIGGTLTQLQIEEPQPTGITGAATVTCEMMPGNSGSVTIVLTIVCGAGTFIAHSLDEIRSLPGAGKAGVGAKNGSVTYTGLKIESSNAPLTATSGPNLLVGLGDSILFGFGTSSPPATSHVDLDRAALNAAANLSSRWVVLNKGIPGEQASEILGANAGQWTPFLAQSYPVKIALISAGSNDLAGGATASATQTSLSSLVTAARTAGATKVLITTILPRTAVQTAINTVNTWIKAGSSGADGVVDYTAVAALTDNTNTTYFQGDSLHPNDAGQQQMSAADLAAISALLFPAPAVTGAAFSADGQRLAVTLSTPLAGAGLVRDFRLSNACGLTGASLSPDGLTLTLTLRRPVFASETVTLSYAGTSVVGTDGVRLAPFTARAISSGSAKRAFGPPASLTVAYPVLTWPAVSGATGYRLYASGILIYDTVNAAGANTLTSFTDPAVIDGRPFDQPVFSVSAYDGTGEGPQSGTALGQASLLLQQASPQTITLVDGAVINGNAVHLNSPVRVEINDVRYDLPVGIAVVVPASVKAVLQNDGLLA